jgi:hypothetical protein
MGTRTLAQLEDNLGALEVEFTESQLADLQRASAIELGFPHDMLSRVMTRDLMFGGARVETR